MQVRTHSHIHTHTISITSTRPDVRTHALRRENHFSLVKYALEEERKPVASSGSPLASRTSFGFCNRYIESGGTRLNSVRFQ